MKYERGSFITVPSRNTLRGVHPTAQTLYMWLCSYANETGNCFPSRTTLAEDVGCSERTVDAMLDILCEKGLLKKSGRKDGDRQLSNLYTVLVIDTLAGDAPPPSKSCPTPLAESAHELNPVLTQPNEPCELEDELRVVSVSSLDEERLPKQERRTKDKLAVYNLFSSREQPWWRHAHQKKAALALFDLVGMDKLRAGVALMKEHSDDKYCPQAGTPYEYEEQMPALARYVKRNGL